MLCAKEHILLICYACYNCHATAINIKVLAQSEVVLLTCLYMQTDRDMRSKARTGTLKNPTKCLWRWEPDRRSNFFFSPPAHLCAVTYMTEISLIVTLNN